jgi:hypothetical protein
MFTIRIVCSAVFELLRSLAPSQSHFFWNLQFEKNFYLKTIDPSCSPLCFLKVQPPHPLNIWLLAAGMLPSAQHPMLLSTISKNISEEALPVAKRSKNKISKKIKQKHTTAGIRRSSPTRLLNCRSEAYVWQSGRDAQFSSVCGRM